MSEAPERIITSQCGKTLVHDGMKRFDTDVEYIRSDHVDALLKQAREDALREAARVAIEYGRQQYIANVVTQPQYADDIADDAQVISGEILALAQKGAE